MPRSVQEERADVHAHMVTYQYYDKVKVATSYFEEDGVTPKMSERLQLVKKTVPMGEFMAFYRKQLQYYVFHYHMSRWTTSVRKERESIRPGDVWLIMDYSEKLNKLRRTQIQSEHWGNTAMTIEVAVAEYFRGGVAPPASPGLLDAVKLVPPEERGKFLTDYNALEKKIYYHCSDYKPQVAKVTTHNMEVMLQELLDAKVVTKGGVVYLKTDGCAKQYKCSKAMYLMCKLACNLGLTIDQMLG